MAGISVHKMTHIINHTLEQMEKYEEVLVRNLSFFLTFVCTTQVIFHLEHLSSNISKSGNVRSDCSYRFIHMNDLLKYKLFLPSFHQSHYFGAV